MSRRASIDGSQVISGGVASPIASAALSLSRRPSMEATVEELADQLQQTGLGSRSPGRQGLSIRVPNPFDPEDDGAGSDTAMPTASPVTGGRLGVAPALPQPPRFEGRTMQDRRDFMSKYETYLAAINALQTQWGGAFAMPVNACIETRTKKMIARYEFNKALAKENGLPEHLANRMEQLLRLHADEFRVDFAFDPPVKVKPMKVRLKPGAKPTRAMPRRYSPNDRDFLERHVTTLLKYGLVMTVDTRAVNATTEPMLWPMPVLEVAFGVFEGAKCFFVLDWFRGYWQLPLDEESQEYFSFVTHQGIFTPTRVPMGATDAVAYCQGVVAEIFGDLLGHGVLCWLDDILGYAKDEEALLDLLEAVLRRSAKYGLKLHAKKCVFFAREVKWCGKVVSAEGVRHCPERIQGLVDMPLPGTAADLQQFLCAVNWMRQSLPRFNELTAGLYQLLEAAMTAAASRKKAQLARIRLNDVGWTKQHRVQLDAVRQALLGMVPLAHPSPTADVCLYTDASQDYWGAVVTQLEPGELQLPQEQQNHRPLAFLSGRYVIEHLHCMTTVKGTIPRPLGETLRATKPNEVLHFDFLTMVTGVGGVKYILVLKDGMSGFVELVACVHATADAASQGLLDWFKRFGVVRQWVSDQGAHFKNQVIEHLQTSLGAHHHFTTAYTPWANGTVEVVNREVLKGLMLR
ncbi:hypothetical protein P43SY_009109 [Pythium insidiosum]|uniref:Integrase catalytic domain-containing protein n=1 Tax=Pythium insidiosum TaxID=114742 RepID=A0AAD5Q4A0_PYTIN|nr:hypothetical protein P43SY_009109 [Pythium insidiosum]